MVNECVRWRVKTTLEKYAADVNAYVARLGRVEGERRFAEENRPFEVLVREGNLLTQTGINLIWTLLSGGAGTAYSNANARIGVGNSTQAAADTNTDLVGASVAWKGMETSYPVVSALGDKKITFRAQFGSAEANFAWEEWGLDNGATAHKLLNRKVESLGTKSSGTWQLTVEISLS
jgi:hypothetical protein